MVQPQIRRTVYVTPVAHGYLHALPAEEKQAYSKAMNAVSLAHTRFIDAPGEIRGAYVTPMPPTMSSATHHSRSDACEASKTSGEQEVKQGRGNRQHGPILNGQKSVQHMSALPSGSDAKEASTTQQTDALHGSEQQPRTSGFDSSENEQVKALSKHAQKKAKKNRRKKAGQKSAAAGSGQEA